LGKEKMKLSRIALAAIVGGITACCAAEQKKEEVVELQPYSHTAYWQDFTITKDSPMSDDGRYRLKEVRKNGDVELLRWDDPAHPSLVVKPKPKKLESAARVPTIVVLDADSTKQSARISEMRLK
jgi:hypothetical protein